MRLWDKLLETKNVEVNRQLFVSANDVHTCVAVSGQHNHLQNEKTALALHFEFSMSCLGCRFNYFLIQASCPFSGKEKNERCEKRNVSTKLHCLSQVITEAATVFWNLHLE